LYKIYIFDIAISKFIYEGRGFFFFLVIYVGILLLKIFMEKSLFIFLHFQLKIQEDGKKSALSLLFYLLPFFFFFIILSLSPSLRYSFVSSFLFFLNKICSSLKLPFYFFLFNFLTQIICNSILCIFLCDFLSLFLSLSLSFSVFLSLSLSLSLSLNNASLIYGFFF
jgi:hypothetical protein